MTFRSKFPAVFGKNTWVTLSRCQNSPPEGENFENWGCKKGGFPLENAPRSRPPEADFQDFPGFQGLRANHLRILRPPAARRPDFLSPELRQKPLYVQILAWAGRGIACESSCFPAVGCRRIPSCRLLDRSLIMRSKRLHSYYGCLRCWSQRAPMLLDMGRLPGAQGNWGP